jgi:hypothetical protein
MAPPMVPETSLEPHLCLVSSSAGRLVWCWWTECSMARPMAPETSSEPHLCWAAHLAGHLGCCSQTDYSMVPSMAQATSLELYLCWAARLAARLAGCCSDQNRTPLLPCRCLYGQHYLRLLYHHSSDLKIAECGCSYHWS